MSFRALAFLPGLSVLLAFAALSLVDFPAAGVNGVIELGKLLATLASVGAAVSFERGAYLRRAWFLSAASTGFLLLRDALVMSGLDAQLPARELWVGTLVLLCNVTVVWSSWLMAHTFHVAGLASDESSARWQRMTWLALAGAVVVTSPSLILSVQGIARGDLESVIWLMSAVGDVLSLALIAPILLTAIAMRGGVLIWPWALLTASIGAWLLFDLAGMLGYLELLDPAPSRVVEEFFSTVACMYTAAAAFAHRRIVREGALR